MDESFKPASIPILDAFLKEYQAGRDALGLMDRATMRSALERFLLDEWWLRECDPSAALLADIVALEEAHQDVDGFARALQRLRLGVQALAARLIRSEHALMIQREHSMMLSEDLRRRAQPSSSP